MAGVDSIGISVIWSHGCSDQVVVAGSSNLQGW